MQIHARVAAACMLLMLCAAASALSPRPVDGASVVYVEFGPADGGLGRLGHFEQVAPGRWQEVGRRGQRFDFRETGRDEWSVYLADRSRGVRIQLDLHTRWIYYSDRNSARRELYRITRASAAHRDQGPPPRSQGPRGQRMAGGCAAAVDGRIAWDYQGNRRWNPANLARLCGDARNAQPARCFDRVMHGGLNWGGGTQWDWRNAINLCAASVDADVTIACFEGQLALTRSWEAAIGRCRR